MSQHPSLRSKAKDVIHRSVLKRYERLKALYEKEEWDEERSVYGLPKLKVIKFKMKKEKAVEAEAAAEGAEAVEAPAEAQAKKEAPGKEAPPKADAKGKETKK